MNIKSQLAELRSGVLFTWPEKGLLLNAVEQHEYWRQEGATSFTSWISALAQELDVQKNTLWESVRMVRYYPEFVEASAGWGLTAPPLERLPKHISLELMVLFKRITGVAPDNTVRVLAKNLIEGTARRKEFRKSWEAYRIIVKNKPHRPGRIPKEDLAKKNRLSGKLFEAEVVNALSTQKAWLYGSEPVKYSLFQDAHRLMKNTTLPDVLIAIMSQGGELEIHGIEIKTKVNPRLEKTLLEHAEYVDRIWLAIPADVCEAAMGMLPEHVGIITLSDGQIISRQAGSAKEVGGSVAATVRMLLGKTL